MLGGLFRSSTINVSSDTLLTALLKKNNNSSFSSVTRKKLAHIVNRERCIPMCVTQNLFVRNESIRIHDRSTELHVELNRILSRVANPTGPLALQLNAWIKQCRPLELVEFDAGTNKLSSIYLQKDATFNKPVICDVFRCQHKGPDGHLCDRIALMGPQRETFAAGQYSILEDSNGLEYLKVTPKPGKHANTPIVAPHSWALIFMREAMRIAQEHNIDRVLLEPPPMMVGPALDSGFAAVALANLDGTRDADPAEGRAAGMALTPADSDAQRYAYWGSVNEVLPKVEEQLVKYWSVQTIQRQPTR